MICKPCKKKWPFTKKTIRSVRIVIRLITTKNLPKKDKHHGILELETWQVLEIKLILMRIILAMSLRTISPNFKNKWERVSWVPVKFKRRKIIWSNNIRHIKTRGMSKLVNWLGMSETLKDRLRMTKILISKVFIWRSIQS